MFTIFRIVFLSGLAFGLADALGGCAEREVHLAPAQAYRIEGGKDAVVIAGELTYREDVDWISSLTDTNNRRDQLTITIDGQPVIKGVLGPDLAGLFTARYQGRGVTAQCDSRTPAEGVTETRCLVLLGGELAANLDFLQNTKS